MTNLLPFLRLDGALVVLGLIGAAVLTDPAFGAPAPTLTLSTSRTSVFKNGTVDLKWSTTNAKSCTASGAWSGKKATSGTQASSPITGSVTYRLACSGSGGNVSKTVSVAVVPAPVIKLAASPTSVASGGAAKLTWSVTNATSCKAYDGWSGTKSLSGSQSTGALTANRSYKLTCSAGSAGARSASVAVTVASGPAPTPTPTPTPTPAPTLTLTSSPTSVPLQGAATLTWSSTNATSCTASGSWSGSKALAGNQSTGALSSAASYSLLCSGAGGSISRTVAVSLQQQAPISVTLSANPKSVALNGSTTLTWSGSGATSCTASGGWTGGRSASGTASVGPISRDTTYSLSCSGSAGNAVAMTTVTLREARLSWLAPTKNVDGSNLTDLAGYKIYYGTAPQQYTQTISVSGAATVQRTVNLTPGTWYFAVTALDTQGNESTRSGEVSKAIP